MISTFLIILPIMDLSEPCFRKRVYPNSACLAELAHMSLYLVVLLLTEIKKPGSLNMSAQADQGPSIYGLFFKVATHMSLHSTNHLYM